MLALGSNDTFQDSNESSAYDTSRIVTRRIAFTVCLDAQPEAKLYISTRV
jgi:hypothetical protein